MKTQLISALSVLLSISFAHAFEMANCAYVGGQNTSLSIEHVSAQVKKDNKADFTFVVGKAEVSYPNVECNTDDRGEDKVWVCEHDDFVFVLDMSQ